VVSEGIPRYQEGQNPTSGVEVAEPVGISIGPSCLPAAAIFLLDERSSATSLISLEDTCERTSVDVAGFICSHSRAGTGGKGRIELQKIAVSNLPGRRQPIVE